MICSKMTIIFLIFTLFFFNYSFAYNVRKYGADPNGNSDCTQSFLDAWADACKTDGSATVYVPKGRYLLSKTVFDGKSCNNQETTIRIDGTLIQGSSDYDYNWLVFEEVAGLNILGGTLDGQGQDLWACKKSGGGGCHQGATSLGLYNSKDVTIDGLKSTDSQMFHIIVYECDNVNFLNTEISAPENSPNTDGIHIEQSSAVNITNATIATGDDCISIGPGSTNVWIEDIACGPGHGISIGSLGRSQNEEGVQNVTVKTATFTGTQNGVRIKTFASPSNAFVTDVLFQDIDIVNSQNPILIDQNYCPDNNCPHEGSGVKISDITYKDVRGTSATQVAVRLECSEIKPCQRIHLDNVQLTYNNEQATASCKNALPTIANNVWPSCNE
ncbi:hypothetical protein CASFOL_012960 [Castilleja foliolosa]|uniref:Polygalacturonase n=1 Tax=Castilleja foliolosa TaxID=1961234 RepID=A0ABD3DMN3_9LAMI